MTPEQFCAAFCLSPELHDTLRRCRLAPREVRVGGRVVLPLEAIATWRCEIEPMRAFAQRWLSRCGGQPA